MKGILYKTDKGWIVKYTKCCIDGSTGCKGAHAICLPSNEELPLHPDDEQYCKEKEQVEFEIVDGESWTAAPYGAKLILPTKVPEKNIRSLALEAVPKWMTGFNNCHDANGHARDMWIKGYKAALKAPESSWDDIEQQYDTYVDEVSGDSDYHGLFKWLEENCHPPLKR